ncbi:hypothetical protein LINPERHAP1_LOCUS27459, partial [Linum perenne]
MFEQPKLAYEFLSRKRTVLHHRERIDEIAVDSVQRTSVVISRSADRRQINRQICGLFNPSPITTSRSTLLLTPPSSFCRNSPRNLMASLQLDDGDSPPGEWNVRNNYLAFEDILLGTMPLSSDPSDSDYYRQIHSLEASDGTVTDADFVCRNDSGDDNFDGYQDENKSVEGSPVLHKIGVKLHSTH